jgi:hypothetical protein
MVECEECENKADFVGCCAKHALRRIEKATKGVKLIDVVPAKDGKHKYTAIFDVNGREKRASFGAAGYDDYTITKDKIQRNRYWDRHFKDLKTLDVTKPGYLSLYILWGNSTSVQKNINSYKKLFNI